MGKYKTYFLVTVSLIMMLLATTVLFVWAVDPYQRYRASDKYVGAQRYEIPGVAKYHDYNAFVTGSSMAMNHDIEFIDSVFNVGKESWKTKNFTVIGATWTDYDKILRYIVNQGKAKHAVLALDIFSFAEDKNVITECLVNDDWKDDYEYLLNYTTLKNCIKKLRQPLPEKDLYHWNATMGEQTVFNDYKLINKEKRYGWRNYDLKLMKERFDKSIAEIVSSDDSLQWYIYFPPYSLYEYLLYEEYGHWNAIKDFKNYVVRQLSDKKNVKLYDFQCEPWITDLNEYEDVRHHSHDYHKKIILAIKSNDYIIHDESKTEKNNRKIDSLINNEIKSERYKKQKHGYER